MSSLRPTRLAAPLLALALVVGACSADSPPVVVSGDDPATSDKDLVETLDTEGFTILAALLDEAGLTETLAAGDGDESFTVFAPTDAAFEALAPGLADLLAGEDDVVAPAPGQETGEEGAGEGMADEDDADTTTAAAAAGADDAPTTPTTLAPRPSRGEIRELLSDLLLHHVAEDTQLAADLLETGEVTSLEGSSLEIDTREEPATSEDGEPTEVPTVNGVDISATNLLATNGVIHSVDEVLVPEDRLEALEALIASIPVTTDVMSTLRNTGEHTQLLAAIESAGLSEELSEAKAVTVFAPTDDALGALSAAQQAALADPEILADLLGFHVVGRTVTTESVSNRETVATREGQAVTLVKVIERPEAEEPEDGEDAEETTTTTAEPTTTTTAPPPVITYTVEDVLIEDSITATNGVVHVIGEVLIPDSVMGPGGL